MIQSTSAYPPLYQPPSIAAQIPGTRQTSDLGNATGTTGTTVTTTAQALTASGP